MFVATPRFGSSTRATQSAGIPGAICYMWRSERGADAVEPPAFHSLSLSDCLARAEMATLGSMTARVLIVDTLGKIAEPVLAALSRRFRLVRAPAPDQLT